MIRRRSLLAGGSALISLPACSTVSGAPVTSVAAAPGKYETVGTLVADSGEGPLSAGVDYQGTTYRFEESAGRNLGDYADPEKRFVQHCVMTTHDALPLTVFFRRDAGSQRAEVVFELGRLWSKTPANLDAYTVTIVRGDRTIASLKFPEHFWF
jgi:hypothetical protein